MQSSSAGSQREHLVRPDYAKEKGAQSVACIDEELVVTTEM